MTLNDLTISVCFTIDHYIERFGLTVPPAGMDYDDLPPESYGILKHSRVILLKP